MQPGGQGPVGTGLLREAGPARDAPRGWEGSGWTSSQVGGPEKAGSWPMKSLEQRGGHPRPTGGGARGQSRGSSSGLNCWMCRRWPGPSPPAAAAAHAVLRTRRRLQAAGGRASRSPGADGHASSSSWVERRAGPQDPPTSPRPGPGGRMPGKRIRVCPPPAVSPWQPRPPAEAVLHSSESSGLSRPRWRRFPPGSAGWPAVLVDLLNSGCGGQAVFGRAGPAWARRYIGGRDRGRVMSLLLLRALQQKWRLGCVPSPG